LVAKTATWAAATPAKATVPTRAVANVSFFIGLSLI
jgi:hypothetical protein